MKNLSIPTARIAFFLVLLCGTVCIKAQDSRHTIENLRAEIEKIVRFESGISDENVPGYLIGVIDENQSYVLPFGTTEVGGSERLTEQSLFEIGSVTKLLTSAVILTLNAMDMLNLTDPVNDHIPLVHRNTNSRNLRIEHLLSHTSGFPKMPPFIGQNEEDGNPYANFSKENLLSFYSIHPSSEVGDTFIYSHINYALLEMVIEEVTGLPYHKALYKYVLQPLSMDHTSAGRTDSLTPGYDLAGRRSKPLNFQSFAASEGIKSTLRDLITFLEFTLRTPDQADRSLLYQPYLNAGKNGQASTTLAGWHLLQTGGRHNALIHTGHSIGHYTFVGIVPSTKTGVVLLTNSAAGLGDLGYLVLRMINHQWRRKN